MATMTALLAAWLLGTPLPDSVFRERPAAKRDLTEHTPGCVRVTPRGFREVTSAAYPERRCYAVFGSQVIDPPDRESFEGYWLFIGDGEVWEERLYLDLRENHPFIVVSGSRLRVDTSGMLRIVVRGEPIDVAKATLPRRGVRWAGSKNRLVLEAKLADLRRDSDGDRLSDLEERRMFLDWDDRDTDDDGLGDDRDPLPNMPRGREGTLLAEYFNRMLPVVLGRPDDRASPTEVEFLVANRAAIAGLRSDRRLVVVEPEECTDAQKRFGVSCGMSVEVKKRDDGSYWITWWGGRNARHEFRAKLVNGGWQLDHMDSVVD